MSFWNVLLVIIVILAILLVVLYILGSRMQKRQAEQQTTLRNRPFRFWRLTKRN